MVSTRVTPNSKQETIDIAGGSTFGKYSKISAAKTFNCYLSDAGIEGDTKEYWIIQFPGYQRVLNLLPYPNPYPAPPALPDTVPNGEGRGIFHSIRGNIVIVVVNSNVYSLNTSLGQTLIGTLATSVGEVFMAENLVSQIAIVDGQDLWIYNYSLPAPNLTKQTGGVLSDAVPPSLIPSYVEYHESQFLIANSPNAAKSKNWYVYTTASPTTITQAVTGGVFTIETKADFALAVKRIPARSSNVLVFGQAVCEVWTKTGGTENYTKNPSLSINYGCQSVSTIAEGSDILVWLAVNEDESPVIAVYDGDDIKPISTDGIDYLLGTIKHPEISTAMLYREDGHLFYILTFFSPDDNLTLMYDFNTQLFSHLTNQDLDFHPARGIVYFNLNTYFISLRNAALYQLSSSFTTLNENLSQTSLGTTPPFDPTLVYEMQKMRITSNIRLADSARFIVNSLTFTLEQGTDPDYTGVGIEDDLVTEATNSPANDVIITEAGDVMIDEDSVTTVPYIPRIDLAFSKDGGVTWSNYVSRSLHSLGHRQNILHWEGMGAANDICFQFRFWTSNRFIANNGLADLIL
jgi:hypothetical protein